MVNNTQASDEERGTYVLHAESYTGYEIWLTRRDLCSKQVNYNLIVNNRENDFNYIIHLIVKCHRAI